SSGTTIPHGALAAELLLDTPPTSATPAPRSEYLTTEFNRVPGADFDLYRVMALDAGVAVQVNASGPVTSDLSALHGCGTLGGPLFNFALANPGDYCDIIVGGGSQILETGGKSILVSQYMRGHTVTGRGDPSLMTVLASGWWPCHHRFFSFDGFDEGSYVNYV